MARTLYLGVLKKTALLEKIPHSMVNGDRRHRLLNTTSIAFEYVEGEAILLMMNEYGICASSGSACTSGSLEPSHVLRAMGVQFVPGQNPNQLRSIGLEFEGWIFHQSPFRMWGSQ